MLSPTYGDVKAALNRVTGVIRPLTVIAADAELVPGTETFLALEFLQHTGSFKARAAANLIAAMVAADTVPAAGIVASTGLNADLGFAWAAKQFGVPVTVFAARTMSPARLIRLQAVGADIRLVGATQAEAQQAAELFVTQTGAIDAYTHDEPATSAGAGTIMLEFAAVVADLDTLVVAVGAGGMFSGVTAAADALGIRVIGAEPEGSQALHAALAADAVRNVSIDSIAADSLGAPRVSAAALHWAQAADVRSVTVPDAAIIEARQLLWDHHRLVVEHGSATGLAALRTGAYRPEPGERIGLILCGANTNPADLARHQ